MKPTRQPKPWKNTKHCQRNATRHGAYRITGPMKDALASEKHPLLAAVWWSSLGGLLALFTSSMILAGWTWRKRAQIEEMLRKR